jgi:hypothetical protein
VADRSPSSPFLGEVLPGTPGLASPEPRVGPQVLESPFLNERAFASDFESSPEPEQLAHEDTDSSSPELRREDFGALDELEQLALDEVLNEPEADASSAEESTEPFEGGNVASAELRGFGSTLSADGTNNPFAAGESVAGDELLLQEDEALAFDPVAELEAFDSGAVEPEAVEPEAVEPEAIDPEAIDPEQTLEHGALELQDAASHFEDGALELHDAASHLEDGAFELEDNALEFGDGELRDPELPQEELLEPELSEAAEDGELREFESAQTGLKLLVVNENDAPLLDGEYAIHQGGSSERGTFSASGKGLAQFKSIDPAKPFIFEVRDRACAIAGGAYLNPDDPDIQYGGTWFDWTLVRDDKNPDKSFWPHYRNEMFAAATAIRSRTVKTGIDKFWQHEHITRRPINLTASARKGSAPLKIQAVPVQIRTGPLVRYADSNRVVIWLELVSPGLVKLRAKRAGGREAEKTAYASTVRVGGRHFAAVELPGLEADTFYQYTIELAPLPATGLVPVEPKDLEGSFPKLTARAVQSMKEQLAHASVEKLAWMTFRTLRPKYDKLRFGTGSCRWYPGDKINAKDWGPDMLAKLGEWLIQNPRTQWPHFLFFGGDQIYSDEIGDEHHTAIVRGRFASRVPGPTDPNSSAAAKLIDGAWSGRFAHRYVQSKGVNQHFYDSAKKHLDTLEGYYNQHPPLRLLKNGMMSEQQLIEKYKGLRNRRELSGAKTPAGDEQKLGDALLALPKARQLDANVEPYRPYLRYWDLLLRQSPKNPDGFRYRSVNNLLWSIPDFEKLLPTLDDQSPRDKGVQRSGGGGHPSADGGKHAADFAEYSFLYERAWSVSRNVRTLLANVPTFLMFDDHEVTDDWNFDSTWVRMIHSAKDFYRMWPKTITDALCAYWMYQGWGNKAPAQWKQDGDRRAKILADAQRAGVDALPELRKCIHAACVSEYPQNAQAAFQTGLGLDWHYQIPIDPPFLVPDCRSRKRFVPQEEDARIIDQAKNPPQSQTIDTAQLNWMRGILQNYKGPTAIIAPSTPLLMQKQFMQIMTEPESYARAGAEEFDVASILALAFDSPALGMASNALLRAFRRERDLEHMIRDRSWRDMWGLVQTLQSAGSPLKTLALVSGDVHHSYCMTANLSSTGRPRPEVLQITCSGLQTKRRKDIKTDIAAWKSSMSFDFAGHRLVPGFVTRDGSQQKTLVMWENAVALVDMTIGSEVGATVTYFTGIKEGSAYKFGKYAYRYTSGAEYLKAGEPSITPWRMEVPET